MNWNVYKIFKNGKRAKAPMTTFEYDGSETEAIAYFQVEILENFKEKYRELNYSLLRSDLSQIRYDPNAEENEILRKQILVLGRAARKKGITHTYKTTGGLIFASATNWKWQWCVLEGATNNYIAGLSPRFDNPSEAEKWMERQIQNLK